MRIRYDTKLVTHIGDVKNAKKTFPVAMASTVGLMTVSTTHLSDAHPHVTNRLRRNTNMVPI